ncbi:hypothetical protein Bca101_001518 [Brassica carinata]
MSSCYISLGNLGSIRFRGQERSVVQATQASVVNGRMETTIRSDVVNGHGGKELSLGAKNNITRDSNEIICIAQELQTHEEASEWTASHGELWGARTSWMFGVRKKGDIVENDIKENKKSRVCIG